MSLLDRTFAALAAAGLSTCSARSWGTAPLYAEGEADRALVYRTPGTAGDLAAAQRALLAAGLAVTLRSGRLTVRAR
ncbi:hypothetical protein [uncultured Zoogloea sp.]|uniref:hypothetical protein n=1 Tax=uncultured Zoogloea sp. TaxID=160237 RepID=UPI002631D9F7|nr:hypothetical protein [uncultured Zoogloea sp.]